MTHALNAPEIDSAEITHPTTPTRTEKPRASNLDGKTGHSRAPECAPDAPGLRDWRPTWAVMGPSTTASELAQAWLEGRIEEDQ